MSEKDKNALPGQPADEAGAAFDEANAPAGAATTDNAPPPDAAQPGTAQPDTARPAPPNGAPAGGPPPAGNYPPAGSYPAPGTPMPYTPPPPEKKGRRVGTFTMALCLIAVGVILVMRVFVPGLDYLTIARLSPVILIFLGLEMLVAGVLHKNEKLRYDGLSIFISLLLIGGSLLAAAIPEVLHYEIAGNQVGNRLAAELEEQTAGTLAKESGHAAYSVEWYIGVDGTSFTDDMQPQDLLPEHYVQVRVFLPEEFDGPVPFAKECRRLTDQLLTQVPHIDYASFYSARNSDDTLYSGPIRYALWLENRFELNNDAGQMAEMVDVRHWYEPYGMYMTQSELESAAAEQAEMERAEQEAAAWEAEQAALEAEAEAYDEMQPAELEEAA